MSTLGTTSRAAVKRVIALRAELRLVRGPGLYADDVILGLMVAASLVRSR